MAFVDEVNEAVLNIMPRQSRNVRVERMPATLIQWTGFEWVIKRMVFTDEDVVTLEPDQLVVFEHPDDVKAILPAIAAPSVTLTEAEKGFINRRRLDRAKESLSRASFEAGGPETHRELSRLIDLAQEEVVRLLGE
jgi:hypothetical protein